jgi:hypothetical protein
LCRVGLREPIHTDPAKVIPMSQQQPAGHVTRYDRYAHQKKFVRNSLIGCVVAAVVLGFIAYRSDHEGHIWFHLPVELTVFFLTIPVLVLLVEKVVEHSQEFPREDKWAQVRVNALLSLCRNVIHICFDVARIFTGLLDIPEEEKKYLWECIRETPQNYKPERITAMRRVSQLLKSLPELEGSREYYSKMFATFLVISKPNLDMIRYTIYPTMLHSYANQKDIEEVLSLMEIFRMFESTVLSLPLDQEVRLSIAKAEYVSEPDPVMVRHCASLLASLLDMAADIVERNFTQGLDL